MPTADTYRALGVDEGTPLPECIRAYDKLERDLDPRIWPVAVQPWLLDLQNERDEALTLIHDAATWGRAQ